ncbi:cation diffusion facilitator family transporter [Micromonospora sp. BL4]|uniref:cation diffusion facilitator family transporter n=1 Tax=Micromonospora sp. BL4 TaxID=2478710 RepID=UPI000EF5CF4C|nr:cation diffusion facilitator family transporter [Micromonospora sp. BL4]RLP84315.1 cation diffusion facilitator family transporter [Micromonospora sp. BL4]
MTESDEQSQSVRTVIVAGSVNVAVAVAKVVAGLLSSSAAMLSEAAHSFADTTTEVLLFVALRRGGRRADAARPFGYGRESYIWALLAAVFTFVSGAGFSITHGVHVIASAEETGDYLVSYAVLVVSFVLESVSLIRTVRQVRRRAKRWKISPARVLRRTPNTTIMAVFLEDSAALVGLGLAGAGLGLAELTGDPVWDGIASVAIGVLLLVVATILARNNLALLVGRSAREPVQDEIRRELAALPSVQGIVELLTLQLGPDDILVVARIDFADEVSGADIEDVADEAKRRLTARNPAVRFVFLNPTRTATGPEPPPP